MVGKPRVDTEGKQAVSAQVIVRFTPTEAQRLKTIAVMKGTTISSLLREAAQNIKENW